MPYPYADEEDPVEYFEQDPDADDTGDGYVTRKSGKREYAPIGEEAALQLHAQGKADIPGLDPPKTAPLTAEEKAPLEASPEETSSLERGLGEQPEKPKVLDLDDPEEAKPQQSQQQQPQPAPPPERAPLAPPALPGARGPAKFTDSSQASESNTASQNSSNSVSRTGSAQPLEEFQAQQRQQGSAYDQAIGDAQRSGDTQSAVLLQHQQQIEQMARDKEAATKAAVQQDAARKAQVQQKMTEVTSRKTDMNGLWKDKGALGTTLGLVGVALRSLNSTKFGGPNTALQSIQEQKRQNLQAQMDDRNSELRGLERELGSIDAAAPVLEARMNDAMAKHIDAMTVGEKSAAVQANAKDLSSKLRIESAAKMKEGAEHYYGTLAQQQSQAQSVGTTRGQQIGRDRVSGAGVGVTKGKTPDQIYDEKLKRDKEAEERGASPMERKALWEGKAYPQPSGESAPARTNREQEEKSASDEAKRDTDQGKAASVQESGAAYARSLGFVRGEDNKWVKGGKEASADEQEAAREALRASLHQSGYDESAAKHATPERGGVGSAILDALPFGFLLSNSTTPEEQAARLNATEGALRPRLNPADRKTAPARSIPYRPTGNMNQGAR